MKYLAANKIFKQHIKTYGNASIFIDNIFQENLDQSGFVEN